MKHPGPFRSRLIPYVDQIKAWRRAGKTWQEVTGELAKLGVKTDPGTACRFMGRWKRKPYPIGAEPDEASKPAPSPAPAQPAAGATPPARPSSPSPGDPGFAEAEPDDPTPAKTRKLREWREQQERERREREQQRNPDP